MVLYRYVNYRNNSGGTQTTTGSADSTDGTTGGYCIDEYKNDGVIESTTYSSLGYSSGPSESFQNFDLDFKIRKQKYECQWILREGRRVGGALSLSGQHRITNINRRQKILRCNRRGIGLRIRKDN
jgi:hypothetical protein